MKREERWQKLKTVNHSVIDLTKQMNGEEWLFSNELSVCFSLYKSLFKSFQLMPEKELKKKNGFHQLWY